MQSLILRINSQRKPKINFCSSLYITSSIPKTISLFLFRKYFCYLEVVLVFSNTLLLFHYGEMPLAEPMTSQDKKYQSMCILNYPNQKKNDLILFLFYD